MWAETTDRPGGGSAEPALVLRWYEGVNPYRFYRSTISLETHERIA
jgi:hypothetical protein